MTDLQNRMILLLECCLPRIRNKALADDIREILDTNLSSPELQAHQDGSIDKLNKTLKETNTMLDYLNKTIQRR